MIPKKACPGQARRRRVRSGVDTGFPPARSLWHDPSYGLMLRRAKAGRKDRAPAKKIERVDDSKNRQIDLRELAAVDLLAMLEPLGEPLGFLRQAGLPR